MKKLLIFIFISFVAQKAAVIAEQRENEIILGKDAYKIIQEGLLLDQKITNTSSLLNDYRFHLIYKGAYHICWLETEDWYGWISKTKCEKFIDVEWED